MTDDEKSVQDVQLAIEDLLRLAKRRGIIVCGFAFGYKPFMMTNFGNCNDAADLRLYEMLVRYCDDQRKQGNANYIHIGELN